MKKLVFAIFWLGQYLLGAVAIIALHKNLVPLWVVPFLASYYSTVIAGKMLGLGPETQERANQSVPPVFEKLFKGVSFIVIILLLVHMARHYVVGPSTPATGAPALVIFYAACASRDIFLVRSYLFENW